jgi:uncharacterized protein
MIAKLNAAGVMAAAVRAACLALALVAVVGSARAEQKTQAPPEPSANALKMAREIIDLKNATILFEPMVPGVIERVKSMLLQTSPGLKKDLDDVANSLRKVFAARTADLLTDISWVYASRFTEAELKEILTFYRTPTGKKVISQEPQVFDDAMAGLPGWQEKFGEEVIARFRAEMKKRGHDL